MTIDPPRTQIDLGKFFLGLCLVALGLVFSLERLGYVELDIDNLWHLWPIILIVFGLSKLLSPECRGRRGGGWVLLTLGTLFLLDNLHAFPFDTTWPLILVVVGALMAFRAWRESGPNPARKRDHHA